MSSRAQREAYVLEFDRILTGIEIRFAPRIARTLRTQFQRVAEALRQGNSAAVNLLNQLAFTLPMTKTIQDMYVAAGIVMANRTLSSLRKSPMILKRTLGYNRQWTEDIIRYFRSNNLEMVNKINETSRRHIIDILEKGLREGWGYDRIAKEINDKIYIKHRAVRIARTESTRAANYGTQIGANEYDYEVVKEWAAVGDERTRRSHMLVDGQTREVGEFYSNGLLFPGDPEAPAEETVNCRCGQLIVPKRDSNGRLIPKSRISVIQPGNFVRNRQIELV